MLSAVSFYMILATLFLAPVSLIVLLSAFSSKASAEERRSRRSLGLWLLITMFVGMAIALVLTDISLGHVTLSSAFAALSAYWAYDTHKQLKREAQKDQDNTGGDNQPPKQ